MADIKELADLMRELEGMIDTCTRCGACQAVCPVFEQTGNEADVARGKLALLEGVLQEMFKKPGGVAERLDRCLLCGSCEATCSGGVKIQEIFIRARAIITGFTGLSSTQKFMLRQILARPELFDRVFEWLGRFQKFFLKPLDNLPGTSCPRLVSPLLTDRHVRPPALKPFHRMVPSLDTSPGSSGKKAAFFVGCLIDKLYPNIARDTVDVLTHHGVGIYLPDNQGCCGIPAISAGDPETFETLVRHNIERFDPGKFDFLVTACATCTYTIKKIWPMMMKTGSDDLNTKMSEIVEKTMDINWFLIHEIGIEMDDCPQDQGDICVTYHDPCHLKKSLDVSEEPRALLKANPAYRYVEMPEADRCCGLGGSFNLKHYDLSEAIGKQKIEAIRSTGCSVVTTGCPACMFQLSDMLSKSNDPVSVKHPVELYAEKLKDSMTYGE